MRLIDADEVKMIDWKFKPLYEKCPNCGADLTEHFIKSNRDNDHAHDNEKHANRPVSTRVSFAHKCWMIIRARNYSCLQWMIDPFAKSDKEASDRNERCRRSWKLWQKTCSGEQKNRNASGHDNFVPVVKRKLGERVLHWLSGCD